MMARGVLRAIAGMLLGASAACSLLVDTDGLGGSGGDGGPPSTDAASEDRTIVASGDSSGGDGGTSGSAGDAGADVFDPSGAFASDDFEQGATCGSWDNDKATLAPAPVAHSGLRSCVICTTGTRGYGTRIMSGGKKGHYQLSAWLRLMSGNPGSVEADIYTDDGNTHVDGDTSNVSVTTEAWSLAQVGVGTAYDNVDVTIELHPPGGVGTCLYVDDVRIDVTP